MKYEEEIAKLVAEGGDLGQYMERLKARWQAEAAQNAAKELGHELTATQIRMLQWRVVHMGQAS